MRNPREIRFAVWVLAVIGASIGQRYLGLVEILLCLLMIAALLATSPVDAIRLPRWVSEVLIATIALMLHGPRWQFVTAIVLLVLLRVGRQSPWWAVLIAWFPVY